MTIFDKWDFRFFEIAEKVAEWSKDPSTRVGAVIVKDRRILATGYNGIPSKILDDDRTSDRIWKLAVTIHAESNAILNAAKNGTAIIDSTLYCTLFPCSQCAASIIQSGIKRVVAPAKTPPLWKDSFEISRQLFEESEIKINLIEENTLHQLKNLY